MNWIAYRCFGCLVIQPMLIGDLNHQSEDTNNYNLKMQANKWDLNQWHQWGTMVQPTMIGGVRGTYWKTRILNKISHFMILFRGQTWVWSLEWFGGPQAFVSHSFCLIHSNSGKMLQRSLSRLRKVRDDLIKQERCGAQSGVWLHRMPTVSDKINRRLK